MAGQSARSIKLSAQGRHKADTALLKFGSKADLAAQLQMSRTTINKFFKREPVQQKQFRAICKKLKLILEEVADLPRTVESEPVEQNQGNGSDIDELVREVRSRCCDKILHLYSKIRLLNRQQIDVDKLYVDVYVLEKLTSESHAKIPDLLKNFNPQHDRIGLGQRGERSPGFEIAAHHPRLMVLGKPGSGKTTFLRHLTVACCKGEFLADYIPILIELRGINASEFNLFKSIHQEFDLPNEEQTKQILNLGKTVILLDGLDEVPSQSRRDVQDHIYKFPQQQHYYKNRFILTCRTQTTEYISDKFECVEVAEFTPKQVDEFAQNWFASFAETPEQAAGLTVNFLKKLRLLENQPTAELVITPILLSLTCWVFTDLKDLPAKRSDLYEQGINLLLQNWDEKRGVRRTVGSEHYRNLSVAEKKKLLSYLAVRKFEQEQFVWFEQIEIQDYITDYLSISTEDSQEVLEAIEAQHGLLIKRAQDIWSFSHLTFQEYFAAKWFCDRVDWQGLAEYVRDKHWREVFLLSVGIVKIADRLLCLMKQQIDSIIADEQLQQFLRWVSEKSLSVNVSYNPAAIRAFYLSLALDIHYQIAAGDNGIVPISPQLVRVLDHKFFSIIEPDLALDVTLKLVLATEQEVNNHGLAQSILSSAHALYYAFYHDFNPEIKEPIQQLRVQLPNPSEDYDSFMEWWEKNGKAWTKQLRLLMIQYRDIGHDWQQFKEQPKELLTQYYNANKLLVDCLNSGCVVSDEVRKEIENTLLLPIDEIKKRQQQVQVTDVADK